MSYYDMKNYELSDYERPGLTAEKFDKNVRKHYIKKLEPDIKPHKIFEGFKKKKMK